MTTKPLVTGPTQKPLPHPMGWRWERGYVAELNIDPEKSPVIWLGWIAYDRNAFLGMMHYSFIPDGTPIEPTPSDRDDAASDLPAHVRYVEI